MRTLLYFTADWCRPCKQMRPIIEKMYQDNPDFNLEIIDVDKEIKKREEFSLLSVPTFVLLQDNAEIKRTSGAKTEEFMKDFIYG